MTPSFASRSLCRNFALSLLSTTFIGGFSAFAVEVPWLNGSDSGDFMDPSNWSTGLVPSGTDQGSVSNGGTANISGGTASMAELWAGENGTDIASGFVKQTGGDLTFTGGLVVGRAPNTVPNSGTGTYTMTGGTITTKNLRLGAVSLGTAANTTASGTMTIDGAGTAVTASAFVGVGVNGAGSLTLSNSASLTVTGATFTVIGGDNNTANQNGGTGVMTISSGASFNSTGAANLIVGRNTNGNGTLIVDGGSITMGTGLIGMGSINGGTVGGTGVLTLNSGTITTSNNLNLNQGSSTVNFNGGTAAFRGFFKSRTSGASTVNFNGSVIQASAGASSTFITFSGAGTGTLTLNVLAGGLKFDSNGNIVVIDQIMTGAGGLTKLGDGELILSGLQGYTGDTSIDAGTLSIDSAFLNDGSSVSMLSSAFFDLSTAGATDTISSFVVDGVAQAVGTYGAMGSGAQFERSYLTGTGFLDVVAIPEPSIMALAFLGICAMGGFLLLRRLPPETP